MKSRISNIGDSRSLMFTVESTVDAYGGVRQARVSLSLFGFCHSNQEWFDVSDIADRFEIVVRHNGSRDNCQLYAMPAEAVYEGLSSVLLGRTEQDDFVGVFDLERFRFWFHTTLGDGWILLITCKNSARFVFTEPSSLKVHEGVLDVAEVESTLVACRQYLRALMPTH